jgi:thiaminase/transcriptional activator TenA
MGSTTFRSRIWTAMQDIFTRILAHPFIGGLTDAVGESASAAEQTAMREHVVTTSRYEWMFWDAGWRRETWPV